MTSPQKQPMPNSQTPKPQTTEYHKKDKAQNNNDKKK